MELERRNIELAALVIIVSVICIRIDPDWMGRIANILMTMNPFTTALMLVAASQTPNEMARHLPRAGAQEGGRRTKQTGAPTGKGWG